MRSSSAGCKNLFYLATAHFRPFRAGRVDSGFPFCAVSAGGCRPVPRRPARHVAVASPPVATGQPDGCRVIGCRPPAGRDRETGDAGRPMTTDDAKAVVDAMLSALSAVLPVGIVAVDTDGDVWYHNQRWENATGVPLAGQVGRRWYDAVHPDDREEVAIRWCSGSVRRGHVGPFRTMSANGSVHDCLAESAAVQDPAGT